MEEKEIRLAKFKELVKKNKNPFWETKFSRNTDSQDLKAKFNKETKENLFKIKTVFTIAGRVRFKRPAGKTCFLNLQDRYGQIQIYVRKDVVSETDFKIIDDVRLGDIIGISGTIMKTNTQELTIRVQTVVLLAKTLEVLPDKYHGMVDVEERYRMRYVDLIMSQDIVNVFLTRTKIIRLIQKYLDNNHYLEVETPILQNLHGGALARPFKTHHNAMKRDLFLRIATELDLKKLIVGGLEKVYEIGRIFRNEGMDSRHNPEFTSIEIYTAYDGMEECIHLCEIIFHYVASALKTPDSIIFMNHKININQKFVRISMVDAVKKTTGYNFKNDFTEDELQEIINKHGLAQEHHFNKQGHILNLLFGKYVENTLIQPTFVFEYPLEISPLAKISQVDKRFTDRFELFVGGNEFANGFAELNDPFEQEERFRSQLEEKVKGNLESHELDHEFIKALLYGLPPTAGLGIGIDRMVMLFTQQSSIKDVILFPTMKTKN